MDDSRVSRGKRASRCELIQPGFVDYFGEIPGPGVCAAGKNRDCSEQAQHVAPGIEKPGLCPFLVRREQLI